MKKIKIFLASSNELQSEREHFEREIYRKCKAWIDRGIFLHLDIWEDLSARMSLEGSQSAYNQYVKAADLFVLLVHSKVGMYTAEEFDTAFGQFQATKKPFIFTYFKTPDGVIADASLAEFHQRLKDLHHFYSPFNDKNDLWMQFNKELDRLETDGFTEFKREDRKQAGRTITQGDKSIYVEKAGDNTTINIQ
ncbi:MAG: hypothetical protein DYH15_06095 [Nitrosomonas sp. PRO4]|nr:hypothetical protein [Nitrosomonas sp. PRO4]